MKAMILAAGRGKRMMPLTANTPKPLLDVKGLSIIEHNIIQLQANGFNDIIINTAYLGQKIAQKLGNGSQFGVNITYSHELGEGLETAGGIINALPLLSNTANDEPFLVLNSDTLNDYPLVNLKKLTPVFIQSSILAHLILVPNPAHNLKGDFDIEAGLLTKKPSDNPYTFSGIGVYHFDFFKPYHTIEPTCLALLPLLESGIKNKIISAEIHQGFWCDIGTPERLAQLNQANNV